MLYRGKTVDIMDFIAHHAAEARADAGHGWQQIQSVGVMVFGGVEEGEFDIAQPLIVIADERELSVDTLVHAGSATRSATPSRLAV
jgi:hypothetical protein